MSKRNGPDPASRINSIIIDLLWLRPGCVGGTETYVRGLLKGLQDRPEPFRFTLLCAQDNVESFAYVTRDPRFTLLTAPINCSNIGGRILWQYLHENRFLKAKGYDRVFSPVYCRPYFNGSVRYLNTIHDLQAMHFPELHPFHENFYSRVTWHAVAKRSSKIIAISEYVRRDIMEKLHVPESRIVTVGDPIDLDDREMASFKPLAERYGLTPGRFLFSLSQDLPHKNMRTLLSVMQCLDRPEEQDLKLVIAGIAGRYTEKLRRELREMGLQDRVILTGYVSDPERNALYDAARVFLFPSLFEGFGIPPLEALSFGTPVITTRCASIPEVVGEAGLYVDDPMDAAQWCDKIRSLPEGENISPGPEAEAVLKRYDPARIAGQLLEVIKDLEERDWEI